MGVKAETSSAFLFRISISLISSTVKAVQAESVRGREMLVSRSDVARTTLKETAKPEISREDTYEKSKSR